MELAFGPQNGDAVSYLELGSACATLGWPRCWDPLRPMGAVLLYSLPYRLKLPPESIIVLNWLLLLGSVAWTYRTVRLLQPGERWRRWPRLAAIVVGHLLFFWRPSWNALSDVPATVFALAAMQGLLLARVEDRWWRHLTTGLCLGASVWLRAFYLYPAMVTAVAFILASVRQPRQLLRRSAVLVMLLPIALNFYETYRRTSLIGYIYPPVEALGRRMHFQSTLAGYDSAMGGPLRYEAKECFGKSHTFEDAVNKKDISALACVLTRRYAFYFGTYTVGGTVYIATAAERHKSAVLLIVNSLVLVAALARLGLRRRRPESLLVGLFVLTVVAESLFIVPESRYLYLVFVWMWCDLLCVLVDAAGSHLPVSSPN